MPGGGRKTPIFKNVREYFCQAGAVQISIVLLILLKYQNFQHVNLPVFSVYYIGVGGTGRSFKYRKSILGGISGMRGLG